MKTAVVVDCVRTPIGRAHPERGWFRDVRGDDLAVACIRALVERSGVDPDEIEDVLLGCTQQTLEQGMNMARAVALMAGVGVEAGGATINRLCGSSLQAVCQAAHAIMAGCEDVQVAGGVEHMQHLPMDHGMDINPKLYQRTSRGALNMGVTAEFLAQTQDISRDEQDAFALQSHRRAADSHQAGRFRAEIAPLYGRDEQGLRQLMSGDQCVREDTSLEALAQLDPAFMPKGGTVTAGNSSPLNDGASALLLMSEQKASQLGLRPLVKVVATAVAGVDPCVMGTGPVPATRKVLGRAKLTLDDIGLIELNEAFAAQSIACIRALELDVEKVNVNGGAIAIGHPLGASGARIATTLIHAMVQRDVEFGLATMCIGFGQGIAAVFQRVG